MQSSTPIEVPFTAEGNPGLAIPSAGKSWPARLALLVRGRWHDAFAPGTPPLEEPNAPQPAASANGENRLATLVDEMLAQSRYALLLRPQLIGNLTHEQFARTRAALAEGMCLAPEGEVVLHPSPATGPLDEPAPPPSYPVHVEAFYLDRYPVTNAQFQQFVSGGGYEQMAIWAPEIWPAVLDFVDATGHPGPAFWRGGKHPRDEGQHPVVGVSWYEASAYARWAGKRLPTDGEWVKAASWPVALAGHPLIQRRYPWGEAMDRGRANLWGSGPGRTVRVDQYPGGVSVGGAQQLIGNVWEWTGDPLVFGDVQADDGCQASYFCLRGGAFDTYLDSQATCHFQSGDRALARKHNIGFRCAISVCDLATLEAVAPADTDESPSPLLEETHA
jgi:iron(II)-dependent oxidoreductase